MNDSERNARRDFHLALPFGIIPGVGVLVSFALTRREGFGIWARRIRRLAAVDLLVLLGATALFAFRPPEVPQVPRTHIGIVPSAAPADGVALEAIFPESPAERAGLKAGDVILSVDGLRVRSVNDFITVINLRPQDPRELTVRRAQSELRIAVTPERQMGMFVVQPVPTGTTAWRPWVLFQAGLTIAALIGLALRARAKQVSMLPAVLILGVLVFSSLVQQLVYWLVSRKLGGFTTFGWLVSTMVASGALLGAAAWALWFAVRRAIVPAPNWNPPEFSLIGRGLLYVISFGARAGVLAWALWSVTGLLRFFPAEDPWGPADGLPTVGALLFAADAVAIAPLAEELLFRGLFLPWLERLFTPGNALLVSAAVFGLQHIAYGPGVAFIIVVGLVLGWARQRTGGLAAPLFIHTVNNGLVTLLRLSR